MRDRYSRVELARLPEPEAVRLRFDARNLSVGAWLARGFAAAAAVEMIVALSGPSGELAHRLFVAGLTLLAAVAVLAPIRRAAGSEPGRLPAFPLLTRIARRSPRALILAFIAVAVSLVLMYPARGDEAFPWLFVLPFLTSALRLAGSELLLLHGLYLAAAFGLALFSPGTGAGSSPDQGFLIGALSTNAMALGIAAFATRRFRRHFLEEWRELRDQFEDESRMRREIASARDVQLAMLPSSAAAFEGLDVSVASLPATEVGGDYYGYFRTGQGRVAVVSADVAGHGLASGIVLSGIRSGLTLLSEELDAPGRVMERMHRMVRATNRSRMLVTLAILLIDPAAGRATIASAGHPPILLRKSGSDAAEEIELSGLPLGAALADRFAERSVACGPGDVFLLHTDGLYEATNVEGEPYGLGRLGAALGSAPADATADEIREGVLDDLRRFRNGAAQRDDVTIVVVRLLNSASFPEGEGR